MNLVLRLMGSEMTESPIIIDVIGDRCPIPVQKLRRILKQCQKGSTVYVFGDDPESLHDIPALLVRLGIEPAIINKEEIGWKFEIAIN